MVVDLKAMLGIPLIVRKIMTMASEGFFYLCFFILFIYFCFFLGGGSKSCCCCAFSVVSI